jgi:hypothetical protein
VRFVAMLVAFIAIHILFEKVDYFKIIFRTDEPSKE